MRAASLVFCPINCVSFLLLALLCPAPSSILCCRWIHCVFRFSSLRTRASTAVVKELVDATRKEPGNIRYGAYQKEDNKNVVFILEEYKDQAAFDAHKVPFLDDSVPPMDDAFHVFFPSEFCSLQVLHCEVRTSDKRSH